MQPFKIHLLASASALIVATAFSAPASAIDISGGGSSLIAPYMAQTFDCWVAGGSNQPELYDANANALSFVPAPVCFPPGDTTTVFQTASVGSGAGIKGFLTEIASNLFASGTTLPSGFTDVSFSVSEIPLTGGTTSSDIDVWNNGGTDARGFTVAAHTNVLEQLPLSIDPVAIAYNPNYHNPADNMDYPLQVVSGTLKLDRAAYCGIFNGDIQHWDDAKLTALNGGTSLTMAGHTNIPIQLVGRLEGSGTTQIFTRHLQVACDAEKAAHHISQNLYTTVGGTDFTPVGVNYDLQRDSSGVSNEIAFITGSIGYLGTDYTVNFEAASGAPANGLPAATLTNFHDSVAYTAQGSTATTAFINQAPPPPTGIAQNNPINWVPNSVLADPAAGYPIIGTTNIILKSSYTNSVCTKLRNFLDWYYGNTMSDSLLTSVGLAPMPINWKQAIFNLHPPC